MRNRRTTIWFMTAVLVMAADQGFGVVDFKDGATHNINYRIKYDDVRVDYQAPGKKTTVNMLAGGSSYFPLSKTVYNDGRLNMLDGSEVFFLYAYDSSKVTVSGGFNHSLDIYNSSQLTMSGGSTYILNTHGSSQLTISDGSVGLYLGVHDESLVMWSGGTVTENLWLEQNGVLEINGSNFAVDGSPVGFGEIKSTLGGYYENETFRTLTGTLANGDIINNSFRIGDYASITLVPEPASALLIGAGFFLVRSRRRQS